MKNRIFGFISLSIILYALLLICVVPMLIFAFTCEGYAPHTLKEIEKKLDKCLTVNCGFIEAVDDSIIDAEYPKKD